MVSLHHQNNRIGFPSGFAVSCWLCGVKGVPSRQDTPTVFLLKNMNMEEIIMKQLAEIRLFSLLAAKNVLDI